MKIARSNLHNTRLPKVSFVLTGQATLETLCSRAEPPDSDGRGNASLASGWLSEYGYSTKAGANEWPLDAGRDDRFRCFR